MLVCVCIWDCFFKGVRIFVVVDCGFGYCISRFKQDFGCYVVFSVIF